MDLTPRDIVQQLDKYIIGQDKAKRAVAVALRNRYRRSKLTDEQREEITPKNIIMKGPTGVGKTEIARRLARLVKAPFIKVEATKYTEVGYVGRDVESMVRDLVEASVRMVKEEHYSLVSERATKIAEKQMIKVIGDALKHEQADMPDDLFREKIADGLKSGKYDDMIVEVDLVEEPKTLDLGNGMNSEITIGSIFGGILPKKRRKRKVKVPDALKAIIAEESDKLIDDDSVKAEGVRRAEEEGIIFIDEIDKIAGKNGQRGGADVSREGVQRDILPIVEGC